MLAGVPAYEIKLSETLRIIAIEEALSVPGVIHQEADIRQHFAVPTEMAREWFRRLADLSQLRLADMDANGVDVQVLSLSTPGLEVIQDAGEAVAAARQVNDYLAEAIAHYPNCFAGFAALPFHDPKAAVLEFRRAVEELGLQGVLHDDHVLGHYLDEPQFRPIWAELERLGVTLYLHPAAVPADVACVRGILPVNRAIVGMDGEHRSPCASADLWRGVR